MSYNPDNIFARILNGGIPCKKVYENDAALAFYDIDPKAPVHVLVIPKGPYEDHAAFATNASDGQLAGFTKAIHEVVKITEVDQTGYRLISNSGANGGQEVPHYHVHILGGRALGPMITTRD